jgi:hypothetical protein
VAYLGRNHMRPVLRSCTALVFIPKYTPASDTYISHMECTYILENTGKYRPMSFRGKKHEMGERKTGELLKKKEG